MPQLPDASAPVPKRRSLPRLAITLGDPAGIGPEIILKALADPTIQTCAEITVIGSQQHLRQTFQRLQTQTLAEVPDTAWINPERLSIIDIDSDPLSHSSIHLGQGNAASGAVSFAYLEAAITQTLAGKFDGIVTAPIAKSAWKAAGHDYPGQTEVLAERAHVENVGMLFVGRSPFTGWTLRTLLATTHIPLSQVPTALTPAVMSQKLALLVNCLQHDFDIPSPQIAIAGLNPHSGEQGQLGHEENDWLIPWLTDASQHHPEVRLIGPVPPDIMWVAPGQAWFQPNAPQVADGFFALYHDQGLIPVKLMAFDQAINTTIGLPFIRTSPDHGTAFDIAGQGIARATSMKQAIQLAAQFAMKHH